MARVTELHVRADWGLIRFAYLPLIVAGLAMSRLLPWVAVISLRAAPCAICYMISRWGNHIQESVGHKPILQITDGGLICEDGDEPTLYAWNEIVGIVMHRRNNIPPWRTDGSTEIAPPFWLAISVTDPNYKTDEGAVFSRRNSYAERSRRPEGGKELEAEGVRTITVWPRQVVGGLFAMMRFVRELQCCLIDVADRGEIPSLLPDAKTEAA